MKYTTIYETLHSHEISMIRNLFEENEIHYQMPDEMTNTSYGIAALGINGMRVQVLEEQKEEALSILKERGFSL